MKAGRIEALPGTFTPSSSAAAGKPEERSRSEAPVQMLVDGAALDNLEVGDHRRLSDDLLFTFEGGHSVVAIPHQDCITCRALLIELELTSQKSSWACSVVQTESGCVFSGDSAAHCKQHQDRRLVRSCRPVSEASLCWSGLVGNMADCRIANFCVQAQDEPRHALE